MSEHDENQSQNETSNESAGAAAVNETVNETPAQGDQTPTPGSEGQTAPEGTEAPAEGSEAPAPELGADGKPVVPAFKPQTKFKAGIFNKESRDFEQKEFEIDKRFHALMKDPESEKLVRELHTKAYGLEGVKARLDDTRSQLGEVAKENHRITSSVQDLKGIYQTAVKTQDWLKLDSFFQKLSIPEDHILNYALEKVKLNDLAQTNPAAYQDRIARRNAEIQAEQIQQDLQRNQSQAMQQAYETKMIQIDMALTSPTVAEIAKDFDTRSGREGAFKDMVKREGEYAYLQSQGRVDLTPQQAIERAMATLGLKAGAPAKAPTPGQPNPAAPQGTPNTLNGKPVVQRTNAAIPNINGTGASPLKPKVRSIDDIKNYAKQHHGNG